MFNRLHTYTVHLGPKPEDAPELIREGFSVGAFIFGVFWLLYYRVWGASLVLAAFGALCYLLEFRLGVDDSLLAMVQFGVQLWLGFEGADLRRSALARCGWRLVSLVCETSEERAVLRYYEHAPRLASA